VALVIDANQRYGLTRGKRFIADVARVEHAIDRLRCRLDSQLALDCPTKFDPRIYYPGPSSI
jgi:hypothetical protein